MRTLTSITYFWNWERSYRCNKSVQLGDQIFQWKMQIGQGSTWKARRPIFWNPGMFQKTEIEVPITEWNLETWRSRIEDDEGVRRETRMSLSILGWWCKWWRGKKERGRFIGTHSGPLLDRVRGFVSQIHSFVSLCTIPTVYCEFICLMLRVWYSWSRVRRSFVVCHMRNGFCFCSGPFATWEFWRYPHHTLVDLTIMCFESFLVGHQGSIVQS